MALLHFSDILINAGLDPAKVQLGTKEYGMNAN